MLLQRPLDKRSDISEPDALREKELHSHFIGSTKYCRVGISILSCLNCQFQTGKSIKVRRFEGQVINLTPVDSGELRVGQAVGIR